MFQDEQQSSVKIAFLHGNSMTWSMVQIALKRLLMQRVLLPSELKSVVDTWAIS